MMTKTKICGLKDRIALETAIDAGADMAGFVFFAKSPRNLGMAQAAELSKAGRGRIRLVALTVDADERLIDEIAEFVQPDLLQLHGRESPDHIARMAARTGLATVKAVGISGPADLEAAGDYAGVCDYLLLDAKAPKQADRPGGLGEAFDWTVLEGYEPGLPWLLAGGLTPDNVAAALAISHAPGVDVSSGVESAPGVKDPDLIRAFVAAVRRNDAAGDDKSDKKSDKKEVRYSA